MIGRAFAKVILLGEHAVVYGHPALAAALSIGATAQGEGAPRDRLCVPAWGLDTDEDRDGAPARALAALRDILAGTSVSLVGEVSVPPRAGLGSSAALGVAVARAIAGAAPDDLIERAAGAWERVFHGTPSGIDVALATRGGVGLFRRGLGLSPVVAPRFRLAIGLSGEARDTGARVADIARRRHDHPDTDGRLARLGALATKGAAILERGDLRALGALVDEAQEELAALGLASPGITRLVDVARAEGAAAKLTGAGGGGAVIALGPVDDVVRAWRRHGFDAFVAELGGERPAR